MTFDCSVNKFADLTTEEFILERTGLRLKGRTSSQSPVHFYDAPIGHSNGNQEGDIDIRTSGFNDGFESSSGNFGAVNGTSRSAFSRNSGFSSQQKSSSSFSSSAGSNDEGQGQAKMNIFMSSPMLENEVKDEVDWRKEGAITPVKNQGDTFFIAID